jgi:hypothetical protein
MTQPSSWAAGSAKCFKGRFQEALLAFCFAATHMYAVTTVIGTL